jgi:signal transduction histidine kinase
MDSSPPSEYECSTGPQASLFAALVELCQRFQAGGRIDCRVTLGEGHTRFDPEVGDVLYRAIREFLANVRQHARATHVKVTSVAARDGSIRISVCDNGVGFPAHWRAANPFTEDSGLGLWSVDQRLRAFEAWLEIESCEGATRATVVLPGHLVTGD